MTVHITPNATDRVAGYLERISAQDDGYASDRLLAIEGLIREIQGNFPEECPVIAEPDDELTETTKFRHYMRYYPDLVKILKAHELYTMKRKIPAVYGGQM